MAFIDLASYGTQRKMREIREFGELSPVKFGFKSWNDYDKGKLIQGSRKVTLLIGGEPNHGKSQFANELVMQMIEKHGFRVALFTTESGDVEKVFSYFCSMYQGKPYTKVRPDGKPNGYAMSDAEADEAEAFLMDKLFVFKQNRKDSSYQSLENIYKQLADAENHYGFKFDSLVIDPVYDVDDFEPKAEEVLRVLNRFNLEAEENNRFDIMVNHVAETAKYTRKDGKRVKLIALADEFYGGKNNQRKAMLMLLVHRPDPTVDENGKWLDPDNTETVVRPNQTNVHVLKIKPEGMAKWGIYDIYYDWKRRRYYEMYDTENGCVTQFADCTKFNNERPNERLINQIKVTPEEAFDYGPESEDDDDMPF